MKILEHDNHGSHYRSAIYQMMDRELGCEFCFGDKWGDIKKIDYSTLKHKVIELHNVRFKHCYYQQGMLNLLRDDYDTYIINGESRNISSWLFLIGRKLFFRRKRVFFWSHGMLGKNGKLKNIITKIQYSLVNGAFIYNNRSRQLMIEYGIPAWKLHTIYNSLDYDTQLPIRKTMKASALYRDHFNNDNKNIVFIGRLTRVKRFDLLLDAVAILKNRGEKINVTFIGDGVERQNMEQKVEELGIRDQIWFYGACYDEHINAELIYNADLCVSPGNIGLTAMHVMMFGCPAITNDDFNHQVPEFEAVRDGVTGTFFKVGDSYSLADTIDNWFSNHGNDREEIRRNCYEEIDARWNPHNQIRIFKQVLGIV